MLTNALRACPCLPGGPYGVELEFAEAVALVTWCTYLCVSMTAGIAVFQPMVKAGTAGSVLTSAFFLPLTKGHFIEVNKNIPFCLCSLMIKHFGGRHPISDFK